MKKSFYFFVYLIFFSFSVFSQSELSQSLEDKISQLNLQIQKAQTNSQKIKLYEELAVCQEFSSLYTEAGEVYIACSKLVSEQNLIDSYILKAARCYLSCGDTEKTDKLLTSIATTARKSENAPLLKLYAAWSWLAKCSTFEETHEAVVILESYLKLVSMQSVKKEILFTLWFTTLENNYVTVLEKEFPESLETAMAQGKVDLSPLPFWYFSARKEIPLKDTSETKTEVTIQEKETEKTKLEVAKTEPENSATSEESSKKQEIYTYQLGFYSSKENAQHLVDRCKEKNISAQIQQVTRPSGNIYFQVIVKSTNSEIGTIIKNSGFECYPVFE